MSTNPIDFRAARDRMNALYLPPAATLAKALPEIGDAFCSQFAELARGPDAAGCEALAANLDGARRHVLKLRERLLAEQAAEGRTDGLA